VSTRPRLAALLLAIGVAAPGARANVWDHALGGEWSELSVSRYEEALRNGDANAELANSHDLQLARVKELVKKSEDSYRSAAEARPEAAEPYYRIGQLLDSFYAPCTPDLRSPLTCTYGAVNLAAIRRAIEAWDRFEALAPLDPRVTDLLVERALLHTHLVTDPQTSTQHLEAAARDYQAYLDRTDGTGLDSAESALANLAETHMMLGKLDEAIAAYTAAIRAGSSDATLYGLAVALDRDGRGEQARQLIVDTGMTSFDSYRKDFSEGRVFYVPAGEEQYYFALIFEAFGEVDEAITHWRRFIASGAHPQYQPRAREHLEALAKIHKKPPHSVIEPPWPTDIFP
jgi:tetratricopeptide (TPR) repeat protein